MSKIIAPIVAVVFLAFQAVTGITVSEELQSEVVGALTTITAVAVTLYGVISEGYKGKDKIKDK